MWTKSKRLTITAIAILFRISTCFSQKKIVVNSDTLFCFSKVQSKAILKEIAHSSYLDSLNNINLIEIETQKNMINNLNETIKFQNQISANELEKYKIRDAELKDCQNANKMLHKEIKKQKFLKVTGCVLSALGGGLISYLLLK